MRIFSCQLKKRCLARSIAGSAAIRVELLVSRSLTSRLVTRALVARRGGGDTRGAGRGPPRCPTRRPWHPSINVDDVPASTSFVRGLGSLSIRTVICVHTRRSRRGAARESALSGARPGKKCPSGPQASFPEAAPSGDVSVALRVVLWPREGAPRESVPALTASKLKPPPC